MATDKRVKGCPNSDCENHIKKVKYKATDEFCLKCGKPLVFVCKKCFSEIQDSGPEHTKCTHCMEEAQAKKEQRIDKAKDVAKKAGAAVVGVGGAVVVKVMQDEKKEAVKVGVKYAKQGIDAVKAIVLK